MEVIKISRKNWVVSYIKWWWIVILTRLHIRFHTKYGFRYLKVVNECGYCIEVKSDCFGCHLYEKSVCCSKEYTEKAEAKMKREEVPYLRYVFAMRKILKKNLPNPDWYGILSDALLMNKTIGKDRPH